MIIEDDSICGSKVDTQTTSSGAKQEHKDFRSAMMYKGQTISGTEFGDHRHTWFANL